MIYEVSASGEVEAFAWDDDTDPRVLVAWVQENEGVAEHVPARMVGTIHEQPARVEIGNGRSFVHMHRGQVVVASRYITQREQQVPYVGVGMVPETLVQVNFYVVDDLTQVRPRELDWTVTPQAVGSGS